MKVYNLILIMHTGYTHQIKIKADDWSEAKDQEMVLIKTMMEIDFWKQINSSSLLEIRLDQPAPKFSTNYEAFLKQVKSMKRGY